MLLQYKESVWQVQNTLTSNNSRRVGKTEYSCKAHICESSEWEFIWVEMPT